MRCESSSERELNKIDPSSRVGTRPRTSAGDVRVAIIIAFEGQIHPNIGISEALMVYPSSNR